MYVILCQVKQEQSSTPLSVIYILLSLNDMIDLALKPLWTFDGFLNLFYQYINKQSLPVACRYQPAAFVHIQGIGKHLNAWIDCKVLLAVQ